jgi:glycosyltransferase involved in cell wall biosynthesis
MLSILIPVYNFAVEDLVRGLQHQCQVAAIDFEILCFDDGSTPDFKKQNRIIATLENVRYEEMPENQGRSRIRNMLAKAAQFDYLLFMDCDSGLVKEDYIQQYIESLHPDTVLYGGRVYDEQPPDNKALIFHWTYGKNREEQSVAERQIMPYHGFMTNNFLMPKTLFLDIQFEERLTQYGHEDTLFGLQLQSRNIPIKHLRNPLAHLGLEATARFLDKTKKGIENLYFLSQQYEQIDTKLLRTFRWLQAWKLDKLALFFFNQMKPILLKNMYSSQPNMRIFDLYKLSLLLQESQKLK